jgi:hypothetical protein
MRIPFLACLAPLLLLPVGACGSSPSASPSPPHFSTDAGEAETAPEDGGTFVEAGEADVLASPVCTSVPTGPTGTVSTQGDPGFTIAGGGAWTPPAYVLGADGGLVPQRDLHIILSDQVDTCVVGGDYLTGASKANEHFLSFDLTVPGDQLPVGTYSITLEDGGSPALTIDAGQVGASCNAISATTVQANTHSTLTLTEVAADHVKGTYSVMLGSPVSGTFDVPLCPPVQVSQPCCLP